MAEVPQPAPRPDRSFARLPLAVGLSDALRELILEGHLREGEKIREKALTEQFGVSRTPLREAMKVLAAEGLIELIPNRGAVVSRQSEEELAEGFRVLAMLDRLVGELAAVQATDAQIAAIERMTHDLRRTVERGDRAAYFELNQSIHAALLRAARNDTLTRTHTSVASRVYRARYQANLKLDRWHRAMDEHDRILSALLARDAEGLGALLHDHMMATLTSAMAARKKALASSTDES